MNAVNPQPPSPVARPSERSGERQPEPSMEEILASIRRIIADDQAVPGEARQGLASAAPQIERERDRHADDPLDEMPAAGLSAYGQVTAPQYPTPDGRHAASREPPSRPSFEEAPLRDEGREPRDLLRQRIEAVRRSEAPLRPPVEDAPQHVPPPANQEQGMRDQPARDAGFDAGLPAGEETRPNGLFSTATDRSLSSAFNMLAATRLADDSDELRAMAREMIRPLLKTWLDDNLPSLVERLVRAEIERVARSGR